ncbi:grpE protein [Bacteroides sp. CAG:633]|uniref:hypothetical protein n=1 Tax=Bacteroides sp. CAG:633 TaxID=1262744 RepID=UPI000340098E|nr:hypothetical protein [Bacteroides sp. CAG:633]CDB09738.1 grpE protein [Bacteroides sp. CAG:633]
MEEKNLLETSGEFLLKNSGRAFFMGKDPISVTFGIEAATTQVVVGASLLGTGKLIKKYQGNRII